jgi:hypothetical protein
MRRFLVAMLVVMFAGAAGCAQRDATNDNERQGGFYGGMSGGLSR